VTGIFVTGTDTNIGKTVVSAALLHRYRGVESLRYWKPIQTGFPEDDDTATVRVLGRCSQDEICAEGVRLPRPLSPHLAAQYCGTELHMESLLKPAKDVASSRAWIVEGAGGVLVPLNARQLMIDLIAMLGLPVVIVARSGLGTINHTLLTLQALQARSISVAGVVLVGEPNTDNRRSIDLYGKVPVLGEMAPFSVLNADTLGAWARTELDPDAVLSNTWQTGNRRKAHA
jgi:dethiobiotin synthase